MTIENKECNTFREALDLLLKISEDTNYVFRGQPDYINHRISSTLYRHIPIKYVGDFTFDRLLNYFIASVAKIGELPFKITERMSWMEYGQHHGLPTPCIDFTYSVFNALFFAFDGINQLDKNDRAIYALNYRSLGEYYFKNYGNNDPVVRDTFWRSPVEKTIKDHTAKPLIEGGVPLHGFFEHEGRFPTNKLQFIPFPKYNNQRMIRQQGCFVYDTIVYRDSDPVHDFESLIENVDENSNLGNGPTAYKIRMKNEFAKEVFTLLDKMNINNAMLYLDPNGSARDIKNSYYYNPKSLSVRDS
ncbi:FRG domain-containing protein [Leptospira kmetyi]|uniref:FRG domain-containing protein n=1 Tax=Leptospira kmetyi TaxID=408139 RepID=UPI001082F631|nr:FRG domain-containing protein [Leptospira kmetyi]TGK34427.1 FRG domain-containing protein [Leptospira kmetyi]